MNLPHDLKSYSAEQDSFIVMDSGDAFVAFVCCMALGWLLATFS